MLARDSDSQNTLESIIHSSLRHNRRAVPLHACEVTSARQGTSHLDPNPPRHQAEIPPTPRRAAQQPSRAERSLRAQMIGADSMIARARTERDSAVQQLGPYVSATT